MSELLHIREQLLDTQAALAQLDRALAVFPLDQSPQSLLLTASSLQKRRAVLERDFIQTAKSFGVDVCSYRLFYDFIEPTVAAVASTMATFQELISVVYCALKHGPRQRRRLPEEVVAETAFGFGYSFAGSMGLVFTMSNEQMLGDIESRLDSTFATVFDMTKAETTEEFVGFARRHGIAPLRALYAWADAHVRGAVGVGVDWQRNQDVRFSRVLHLAELEAIRDILAKTGEESHSISTYRGILLGADAEPKRFHFKTNKGDEFRGTYEDAIKPSKRPELFKSYYAEIERIEVIHYSTEQEDVRYVLHKLDDTGVRPYEHD